MLDRCISSERRLCSALFSKRMALAGISLCVAQLQSCRHARWEQAAFLTGEHALHGPAYAGQLPAPCGTAFSPELPPHARPMFITHPQLPAHSLQSPVACTLASCSPGVLLACRPTLYAIFQQTFDCLPMQPQRQTSTGRTDDSKEDNIEPDRGSDRGQVNGTAEPLRVEAKPSSRPQTPHPHQSGQYRPVDPDTGSDGGQRTDTAAMLSPA